MLSANLCLKIYKYICKNHSVTSLELSECFNLSRRHVLRYIKILKFHGLIDTSRGNGGGIIFMGVFNEK